MYSYSTPDVTCGKAVRGSGNASSQPDKATSEQLLHVRTLAKTLSQLSLDELSNDTSCSNDSPAPDSPPPRYEIPFSAKTLRPSDEPVIRHVGCHSSQDMQTGDDDAAPGKRSPVSSRKSSSALRSTSAPSLLRLLHLKSSRDPLIDKVIASFDQTKANHVGEGVHKKLYPLDEDGNLTESAKAKWGLAITDMTMDGLLAEIGRLSQLRLSLLTPQVLSEQPFNLSGKAAMLIEWVPGITLHLKFFDASAPDLVSRLKAVFIKTLGDKLSGTLLEGSLEDINRLLTFSGKSRVIKDLQLQLHEGNAHIYVIDPEDVMDASDSNKILADQNICFLEALKTAVTELKK